MQKENERTKVGYLRRMGMLCMRLTRHIIRENLPSKSAIMRHLPTLM